MAKAKFINNGATIPYVTTAEVKYNDIVAFADCVGVALEDAAQGETVTLAIAGVFEMPAATNVAINVGDKVYYDKAAAAVCKTAENNVPAGVAVSTKAMAGAVVRVKIG